MEPEIFNCLLGAGIGGVVGGATYGLILRNIGRDRAQEARMSFEARVTQGANELSTGIAFALVAAALCGILSMIASLPH